MGGGVWPRELKYNLLLEEHIMQQRLRDGERERERESDGKMI